MTVVAEIPSMWALRRRINRSFGESTDLSGYSVMPSANGKGVLALVSGQGGEGYILSVPGGSNGYYGNGHLGRGHDSVGDVMREGDRFKSCGIGVGPLVHDIVDGGVGFRFTISNGAEVWAAMNAQEGTLGA
jgi:myo-inositol-hexaphosphate 3-phosphohydrolase